MKILFLPHLPGEHAKVRRIMAHLGIDYTNDPGQATDLAFFWSYDTHRIAPKELLSYKGKVVNLACTDASKETVTNVYDRVMHQAFKHFDPLRVNPEEHQGSMLSKGQVQGAKDIDVVKGPLRPNDVDHTRTYTRWIDTRVDEQTLEEFRVPCFLIDGRLEIPLVWVKYKKVANTFRRVAADNETVRLDTPAMLFSCAEINVMRDMMLELGVEYCELDAGRSNHNGQLYVFDMNNTPHDGLFANLTEKQAKKSVELLAAKFREAFLL